MNHEDIAELQRKLGLSDGKMANALGVTRQTWRNWRTGKPCPEFAQNALCWLMELRRLSPANDNIPKYMRFTAALLTAAIGADLCFFGDA